MKKLIFAGGLPKNGVGIEIYEPLFGRRYIHIPHYGVIKEKEAIKIINDYEGWLIFDELDGEIVDRVQVGKQYEFLPQDWRYAWFTKNHLSIGCKKFSHNELILIKQLLNPKKYGK